jgi:hypothetical protein
MVKRSRALLMKALLVDAVIAGAGYTIDDVLSAVLKHAR